MKFLEILKNWKEKQLKQLYFIGEIYLNPIKKQTVSNFSKGLNK